VFAKIDLEGIRVAAGKVNVFIQMKADDLGPVDALDFGKMIQKLVLRRRGSKKPRPPSLSL